MVGGAFQSNSELILMNSNQKFKIAFSGGGFRATLFCLGIYRRLVELGLHKNIDSISSVSGGSIAAGQIMHALKYGDFLSVSDFDDRVTEPLISLCQIRLRNRIMKKILYPLLPRNRFSQQFQTFLDKYLFNYLSIGELPDYPEWSINTTCLNSGKRVRFKKEDFGGNIFGHSKNYKDTSVSFAVACSAAFPMMFAPMKLSTKGKLFFFKYDWQKAKWGENPQVPDYLYLSDGGVYDNLGSETFFKSKTPFIICDASGFLEEWDFQKKPNWFSLNWRPLDTGLDQIVLLRRRLIYQISKKINGYQIILRDPVNSVLKNPEVYGKLSDNISDLPQYEILPDELQQSLGRLRTDLDGFHDIEIQSLMWSGAIRIDIAVKRYLKGLLEEDKFHDTPPLPKYPINTMKKILKRGEKRRYLSYLHKDLKS